MDTKSPHENSQQEERARVFREFEESPGRRLEAELGALALSARTFDVNIAELLSVVEPFENSFVNPLLQPGRRDELWEYAFEIVRLFQNAMSAGVTFLDHCHTTVRRRYRKHPFRVEFEERYATSITDSPVCMFVKELRHYLLHQESITPMLSRSLIGADSGQFDSYHAITLSTDGIESERGRWDKNPKAFEYLKRLHGSINIRRLVFEYRAAVKEFGDWMLKREKEINAQALAESEALHAQVQPLIPVFFAEDMRVFRQGSKRDSWFE